MSIRAFGLSVCALAALPAISSASIIYSPVVTVIGDGSTALSANGSRTSVASYLASFPGQSAPISSAAYNSGATGSRLINSGTATSEGSLTNNPALADAAAQGLGYSNPGYAYSAGYDAALGGASSISAAAANANRAVGRVSLNDWTISGPTVLGTQTQAAAYAANNIRGATGSDAAVSPAFYSAGTGSTTTGGWRNFATNTILTSTPTNVRTVELLGGKMFGSTGSGTTGIYLLDPAGITAASLFIATTASPYEFALFNDPTNTSTAQGYNVAYVADDGIGIQKYTLSGTTWSLAYTLRDTATTFYRGLAGQKDADTGLFTLFATTSDGKKLQQVTDTGAASSFITLATVDGTTSAFRGVALTIPTPGTAALISMGGLLAVRRRR